MKCTKPRRLLTNKKILVKYPQGLEVPCGQCRACKKKKRQEWAMRMQHELNSHEDSCFVTLTYEGEQYDFGSLKKRDLQLYLKRLRKNIGERKIRYFACGEYGEKNTLRPHYHLIIFGLSLRPEDKNLVKDSWGLGQVDIGIAEPASIRYVAQYINKKFVGELEEEIYKQTNRETPFKLASMGLGRDFCDKNAEQINQQLHLTSNGVKTSIPRYYIKRLGIENVAIEENAYERECDTVEHYSGLRLSRDEAYTTLKPDEVRRIEDGIKTAKLQHDLNLSAKEKLIVKKL